MVEKADGHSFYEDIEIFISEFFVFLKDLLETIVKKSSFPKFDSTLFSFDNFATGLQVTLLKVILLLLLTSIVLSGICWKKYGDVITEKFIKPSTQKEIEELKLSVAKLKLPKEHSPRI